MASESAANDLAHEKGLSKEEVTLRYTHWAKGGRYDQDLREEHYKGPNIAAKFISAQFPDTDARENIYILDVAAGTGFAGEKLKEKGFTKLDALEPSEGMLSLAKEKTIYSKFFQTHLNGTNLEIGADVYDLALICGGMGEGHIPCSGLSELVRVVKPGGLVVIVMREQYLETVAEYKDRLEPLMKDMELSGKWEQVSRTVVPKYSFDNNGIVYIYKVRQSSQNDV